MLNSEKSLCAIAKQLLIFLKNCINYITLLKIESSKRNYYILLSLIKCCCNYFWFCCISLKSIGMRKGEILNLQWSHLDLDKGKAILHETKNGERRTVSLTGHALTILREYADRPRHFCSPYVFPSTFGSKPIQIRTSWITAVNLANLPDFHFHDLRHTFASYLAMNGATLAEIAEALGHKTLAMVKRYAHLTEEHTRSVIEKMNEKMFG